VAGQRAQFAARSCLPKCHSIIKATSTCQPATVRAERQGEDLIVVALQRAQFVASGGWADYYAPEGTRFIRSLDVRMNSISDEDAVFVKPPNGAEADRTRVARGDVLLTITGSRIGRVAAVPERLNGAFISQHVAILRLNAGLLPEFLSMFLSLDTGGQRQIARLQYGQTKPGLNLDQIREMRVPVPHVCHQQRFLELVQRMERLRAVQCEALRQAEHLFASLLHRAFSG
jgi:type I restriction enzyme S subunit